MEDELFESLGGGPAEGDIVRKPKIRRMLERAAKVMPLREDARRLSIWGEKHQEVVAWLLAYRGDFPFYLSLRSQYEKRGELSPAQTAAVERAIAREATPIVAIKPTYSLAVGTVIRVSKFMGAQIGALSGLTRAHFTMEVLDVLRETERAYQVKLRMVSQRSSHCCICGLTLTNPESVEKGIGPVCGDGYELDWKSDRTVLEQLSEKLRTISTDVVTWLPKSAIKERYEK